MIYDYDPNEPVQAVEQPSDRRRRFKAWLLIFPLFACVLCAGLTVYALLPLTSNLLGAFNPKLIPVTGDPDPASTLEQSPSGTPRPSNPSEGDRLPSINPQSPDDYRGAVEAQLTSCYPSFKKIYVLESLAVHRPELVSTSDWRTQSQLAMDAFKQDCEPLGKLPDPPTSYEQVDQFLKLASAEVTQADDELSALLDGEGSTLLGADHLEQGVAHLVNFIEFARHIEEALSGLGQRKEI